MERTRLFILQESFISGKGLSAEKSMRESMYG